MSSRTVTGDERQSARVNPLPRCTLVVTCDECQAVVGEFDTNTRTLSGVIMRTRREHAAAAHGWEPLA